MDILAAASVIGRFAPSPTGPLHFGSLVAALGSYLEAKARGGRWLVRMEDVDQPRCKPEHADDILRTLDAFGFEWDGPVMVQSQRTARYRDVLEQLKTMGAVYPCGCTRSELDGARVGADGAPVYPGTCRNGLPAGKNARAWRLRVSGDIDFDDAVQGRQHQDLPRDVGDCVLLRADGYFAYQLAVVVDDADQGIDHVVRGADLIHSTARQIYLQHLLGYPTPAYAHLPVAVDATGAKLSKQTLAAPVDAHDPGRALTAAARFLGQNPPCRLASADFWAWAHEHWQLNKVPHVAAITIEENP
ncbi:MAG: tRNA glutamyl-Q(34) synthetase GluQRS [Rhodocyclaceae bacterium]|nr:tRNA glutamyl-Q(34) synthetase GluQRS [Rhodocyclaceae bacterium]MDZ4214491.1 tRNA glutamyl-Q(34) synthetase GluQRS [Rhodocyclaceae bacterium]